MSAYSAVVLAESSLVSYWHLDETSGTSAADSKGSNTGTYAGGFVLNQTGIPGTQPGGKSVGFHVSNGICTAPDNATLNFVAPFSLECWLQDANVGDSLLAKYNGSAGFHGYGLRHNTVLEFWLGVSWFAGLTTVTTGSTWHHAVATLSGTTAKIYLDGALDNSGTVSVSLTNTAPFAIGTDNLGTSGATLIDEVAVYNDALSAARVLVHYNAGIGKITASGACLLPAM